jgi:uncharacterized membrane protein
MIFMKLVILLLLLVIFLFLSVRLTRRGLSRRYEPKAQTPWNILNEGQDPSV